VVPHSVLKQNVGSRLDGLLRLPGGHHFYSRGRELLRQGLRAVDLHLEAPRTAVGADRG
jgi:hypothetical protein